MVTLRKMFQIKRGLMQPQYNQITRKMPESNCENLSELTEKAGKTQGIPREEVGKNFVNPR
jgi:hypothetical protein